MEFAVRNSFAISDQATTRTNDDKDRWCHLASIDLQGLWVPNGSISWLTFGVYSSRVSINIAESIACRVSGFCFFRVSRSWKSQWFVLAGSFFCAHAALFDRGGFSVQFRERFEGALTYCQFTHICINLYTCEYDECREQSRGKIVTV